MKRVLIGSVIALLLVAGIAAGVWYWNDQRITAFARAPFGEPGVHVVLIPPGSGPRAVASLLEAGGVVSDADTLYAYLRREKLAPRLKAGEYEFATPATPEAVIEKIMAGQVKVYKFTIPEGLRVDEALPIIAASELGLDLSSLTRLATSADFARELGVPGKNLEGFLYPDTYTFTRGATEAAVLRKLVARSLEEYKKAAAASSAKLTMLQAMTLASIIEKETGEPSERPRIGCVFHNRLKLNMPLQTDPTVLYAMMLLRGRYVKNITREDLRTAHPYNTYTRRGLPPGPIASPGAAAIQAALSPMTCNDLFFVSRNDGTHVFCPTLTCHEAQVRMWQVNYFSKKRAGQRRRPAQ